MISVITKPISLVAIFLVLFGLHITATAQAQQPQSKLPSVTLSVAGKTLRTEIANTADQRYMGLSFRKTLAEDEAMLFVYPQEQPLVFTMRNTLLPLAIAYLSKDFIINEIHHMPVGDNLLFPSKSPAKFALEVNEGWFKRNKVSVGSQITMNP